MKPVQLLVSVRNAAEAIAAANGGANIVDVKDPLQGALGFAGWQIVRSIQHALDASCILSAALGELSEWQATPLSKRAPSDLPELQFAKMGLAGQAAGNATSWVADWQAARNSLPRIKQWVAVAYSDFLQCDAPAPEQILEAAITTNCQVLLLDTFVKNGQTSFDHLSESELAAIVRRSHAAGIQVAIAGQVSIANMDSLQKVRPDIVAVRGAVCEDRDRRKAVQQNEVVQLREALNSLSVGV
ncbi:MAG: (5-formylfuran-3-yl)methyl phosphate synthase [Fuerstiella sp.]